MAGSLRTANYKLSKYAAGDVTSWLVDFNGNMDKIDTQMKAIADENEASKGQIAALEQRVATAENKINNNTESINSLIEGATVAELIATPSSNVSSMLSRFYGFLGVFIGTSNLNINKTGDVVSTIEYGSPDKKLLPLILFTGNPFNLATVTSPTEDSIKMCGTTVYSIQAGTASNEDAVYAYFNGTNTILSTIVSTDSLNSSTTFNKLLVTISIKKS